MQSVTSSCGERTIDPLAAYDSRITDAQVDVGPPAPDASQVSSVHLEFGRSGLEIHVPEDVHVLRPCPMSVRDVTRPFPARTVLPEGPQTIADVE
jgi:hypothetical protein